MDKKLDILKSIDFGQSVAEQEAEKLEMYFVKTRQWNQVYKDEIDIVYGPKGAGKSAIYSLIEKYEPSFFQKNIVLIFAENPRGATAFSDLETAPPSDERSFVNLWKLYFLVLIGEHFQIYGTQTLNGSDVLNTLTESGLLQKGNTLRSILGKIKNYIYKYFNPQSFEPNVSFNEQTDSMAKNGAKSVDALFHKANKELKKSEFKIWFLLDRLDVAFADSPGLEENALRALFKTYLDLMGFENFKIKIFLRLDIWRKITKEGFREATHITKCTTIEWERSSLLNLVIRRLLNNNLLLRYYNIEKEEVLSDISSQEKLFYKIFPRKIDIGKNPDTFDWILGRVEDSLGLSAPRDIINLINGAISAQIKSFELGENSTEETALFGRASLKKGLAYASREKTEKYLFAEYPSLRKYFDSLRGGKATQTLTSLSSLWNCSENEAEQIAAQIVQTGFWKIEKKGQSTYWIHFIFRDALEIVQGTAK
ncbi:MAG: hypothetical protein CDV28_12229 [Candidatus Electronema aureum]|uniref:ATPase n=1 Tax=Candidatus Electronema aureum TaxID=2005002 RepID=A0A521G0S0_9BACT|nr:MAG: hypothetical protein CDV28_12229 [Candidatus Electronema aureum]